MENTIQKEFVEYCETNYGTLSDLIRSGHSRECFENCMRYLDFGAAQAAQSCQLLIIKPDMVASGQVRKFAKRLAEDNIVILSAHVVSGQNEGALEELYRYSLDLTNEKTMIGQWWTIKQPFLIGPGILTLVANSSDDTSIYRRVKSLKGPSTPYQCTKGEFRYDMNGTSK